MDESTIYNNTQNSILNLNGQNSSSVSPLEQDVLDEYERLAKNMKEVSLMYRILTSAPLLSSEAKLLTFQISYQQH